MFAAALAVELGHHDLREEHRAVLEAYDLPTGGITHELDDLLAVMSRDKKYERGLRFIVLERLARPALASDVPEDAIAKAYQTVRA
jgi:3-dehydroquinate synthetase